MTRKALSRKKREKLRHKEEILRAALRLFSAKGYHKVSMREIADESEFCMGSMYKLFESKECLFAELMRSCARRASEILLPTLDGQGNERERIAAYIQAHRQLLETSAQAIRLYLSESPISNMNLRSGLDEQVMKERREALTKLSKVFASGMRKGIFRKLDPWAMTLAFSAMLESLVSGIVENSDDVSIDDRISEIESLFFYGILKPTDAGHDI
jgi:TetR/AcrR family transcriptional regulator